MIEKLDGTKETIIYKSLKGIRIYHNRSNFSYPLHWHAGLEIIMPYKYHYKLQIRNITCLLTEGDIIIIPPGELHEIAAVEDGGERLIMQIDYDKLLNIPGLDTLLSLYHPFKWIKKEDNGEISDILFDYLHHAEEYYYKKGSFYEISIYSLVLQFFDLLAKSNNSVSNILSSERAKEQKSYNDKIILACNYINTHFSDDISSEQLAEDSGFCHAHFCRLFKEFTGETFNNYLTRKRISHSENLLSLPGLSITDIAMQSGFNSISTFNRVFRLIHGCSPTDYRNLIK